MESLTADAAGWMAAALTACCFACTRMLRSNLAFIGYGSLAGLAPVLGLHLILAPLNAWHLWRHWRGVPAAQRVLQLPPAPQLPPSVIGPLGLQPLVWRRPGRVQVSRRGARGGLRPEPAQGAAAVTTSGRAPRCAARAGQSRLWP